MERATVSAWDAIEAAWLSDGGGQFEAAIGAYANDHGHRDVARRAFELAAAYDRPDRGRLLSIAALLTVAGEDLEGAEADLARIPDPTVCSPGWAGPRSRTTRGQTTPPKAAR